MQFIFEKTTFVATSAKKRNREKIASKKHNRKKTASKDIASDSKSAHDNKRMNKNVNNSFAEKAANKDCVKKICKTIYYLQRKISV